jgi:hypothetical protein
MIWSKAESMQTTIETNDVVDPLSDVQPTDYALSWMGAIYSLGNIGKSEVLISKLPSPRMVALQFVRMSKDEFDGTIPDSTEWKASVLRECDTCGIHSVIFNDVRIHWTQSGEFMEDFLAVNIPLCILNLRQLHEGPQPLSLERALAEIQEFRRNPASYDEESFLSL